MTKLNLTLFLVACVSLDYRIVCAEKILIVAFAATKSHKIAYMPLVQELGRRGHNVTELSSIRPVSKPAKNVKEILTVDAEKLQSSFIGDPYKLKEENRQYNPLMKTEWFSKVCRDTYDLPEIQALMNETFDLIIIQPLINDCALGFIHKIGAPYILFSPLSVPNILAERLGAHFPMSFIPNVLAGFSQEMTFPQRLVNAAYEILVRFSLRFVYEPVVQAVYKEKLGENIEDFIQRGKHGFIYFSLGSALKGSMMPDAKRQMFLNVFSKLKQQVIWKWETETMPGSDLPKNVLLNKWLPQQDLLGHKDIKMFMTHCGGGSIEESIYHGVPLIGLPMFADQPQNAQLAKRFGFIVDLEWNDLTEEKLAAAIQDILNNSTYRENAQKISTIFRDRPVDPMTHAVYWVEYVIRHKGAGHLRSAARNLTYFQYHSYDVMLTILGIILLLLCLIYYVIRWVYRILLKCVKKVKQE